jgi:hypothetical protein
MSFGQVNADVIGTSVAGSNIGAGNASIMKNRIINGAMVIDQRNSGSAVTGITTTNTYLLDRFYVLQTSGATLTAQRSSTAPAGFTNSLYLTVTSAGTPSYSFLQQTIEGFNVADMGWGTANAKTSTLSFWVQSSITGTYSVSLQSSDFGYSYVATYSITSANTWQQITLTIPGNTAGTWYTDNRAGLNIRFCLVAQASAPTNAWSSGSYNGAPGAVNWTATNGATFYITGVQLEVGSSATGFEYRQYTTELQLCQRYYTQAVKGNYPAAVGTIAYSTAGAVCSCSFPVTMRTTPTLAISAGGTANAMYNVNTGNTLSTPPAQTWWTPTNILGIQSSSPFTAGLAYGFDYTASAEL